MARTAEVIRRTTETDIRLRLDLDGTGRYEVATGIPFFDHMLNLLAKHGLFDLTIAATGDIAVDYHHTVDDVGIVFGQAVKQALGDGTGIRRYGFAMLPMDETLVHVALDISGRPYLVYNVGLSKEKVGTFDVDLVKGFLKGLADHLGCTLHVNLIYGTNAHHILEAVFKGTAKALMQAVQEDPRVVGVPSTKGVV